GANDQVVAPRETERMVNAVRAAGGHPRLNIVPNAGHDVWKTVYNDPQLYAWLMNPNGTAAGTTVGTNGRRPAVGPSSFSAQPGARSPAAANLDEPFVPALSIPNAISIRLGNDALRAIAYSAPKMI